MEGDPSSLLPADQRKTHAAELPICTAPPSPPYGADPGKGGFQDNGSLVKYFALTIRFDGTNAILATGLSTNTFLMDRTPEQLWDDAFRKFMDKRGISWEEI